ncbi:MAG: hypothetical protein R3Y34_07675, partial [Rikenellaceae bacterium]
MVDFLKYLVAQELRRIHDDGVVQLDDSATELLNVAIDPKALNVSVTAKDRAARLVVVRTEECRGAEGAEGAEG